MASPPLSPLLKLRYRGEYAAMLLAAGLIRLMPVDTASGLMGRAWRLIAPRTKRHARALEHVAAAYPDMPAAERETLVRDMWENLGRIAAETFQLDRLARDHFRFTHDVEEVTRSVERHGGACVVVSLHTGNWEVVAEPSQMVGIRTAGVYQALKNPYADAYLVRLRQNFFAGGLFAKGHDTARRLLSHLRSGGAIAFLADLRDVRGIKVPFFGRPAWATTFPVMLARSNDVPLVACRTIRTDGVNFHMEAHVVDIPRGGDRKADIAQGTAQVHALFESWIRENPSQWMWIHRKWTKNGDARHEAEG